LGVLPIGKSMQFVELQRNFAPIRKDNEPTLDVGRIWGRKFGGWLGWSELREHRRVVLLAEASSGKSAEFRNQTHSLRGTRQAAFFVTIEELADHGFEAALEPTAAHTFEQWRGGTGDAWFFLDSLDEARLNRKSFEMALKRFARALGPSIERARILISCRVSDWKGNDDRGFIERLLPAWERPKEPQSGANALLDPIFKQRQTSRTRPSTEPERKPNELLVVQLLPLDLDQCRTLAVHLGVRNADEFIIGIRQNGLEAFAERPGDVIDLADYWKTYGQVLSDLLPPSLWLSHSQCGRRDTTSIRLSRLVHSTQLQSLTIGPRPSEMPSCGERCLLRQPTAESDSITDRLKNI
jgi:hypothetical protein